MKLIISMCIPHMLVCSNGYRVPEFALKNRIPVNSKYSKLCRVNCFKSFSDRSWEKVFKVIFRGSLLTPIILEKYLDDRIVEDYISLRIFLDN